MVSLSNHEVGRAKALAATPSWFDRLTMRATGLSGSVGTLK